MTFQAPRHWGFMPRGGVASLGFVDRNLDECVMRFMVHTLLKCSSCIEASHAS